MNPMKLNRWNGLESLIGTDGSRLSKIVRKAAPLLGAAALAFAGTASASAAEADAQKSAAIAAQALAPLSGAAGGWFSDALAAVTAQAETAAKAATAAKADHAAGASPAAAGSFAQPIAQMLKEAAKAAVSSGTQRPDKARTAGGAEGAKEVPGKPVSRHDVEAELRRLLDLALSWLPGPDLSQHTARN